MSVGGRLSVLLAKSSSSLRARECSCGTYQQELPTNVLEGK